MQVNFTRYEVPYYYGGPQVPYYYGGPQVPCYYGGPQVPYYKGGPQVPCYYGGPQVSYYYGGPQVPYYYGGPQVACYYGGPQQVHGTDNKFTARTSSRYERKGHGTNRNPTAQERMGWCWGSNSMPLPLAERATEKQMDWEKRIEWTECVGKSDGECEWPLYLKLINNS